MSEVTDHAVVADGRLELARAVDHRAVLHRRALADHDAALVAAQHGLGPDRRAGTDHDVADDRAVGMDECVGSRSWARCRRERREPCAVVCHRRASWREGRRSGTSKKSPTRATRSSSGAISPGLIDGSEHLAGTARTLPRSEAVAELVRGSPHAAHLQPARVRQGRGSACRCTTTCCRSSTACSIPGCLISSLSSIDIMPRRSRAADPRRRPAHPAPEAAPADRVQLDVGAHRLHRSERRDPAHSRFALARPQSRLRRAVRLDRGRDGNGSVLIWHGSLWHGGGANRTDAATASASR